MAFAITQNEGFIEIFDKDTLSVFKIRNLNMWFTDYHPSQT